jgi:hypothetical protein
MGVYVAAGGARGGVNMKINTHCAFPFVDLKTGIDRLE